MLLRSKFFSSIISDINDEDRTAQSFNIFIDCELAELSQVVLIASLNSKKGNSNRGAAPPKRKMGRRKSLMMSPTENS